MKILDWLNDTRQLNRAVQLAFVGVIVVTIAFGGYYYWDRYVHLGDESPVEKGIAELEALARQNPDDPNPRLALAETYLQSQQYTQALEQAQQVLSLYPENERALFVVGLANAYLAEPGAAVTPLEKFVALRKDLPTANSDLALETALYFLGESYLKLQRPADAIAALSHALTISPTDADAIYQLGLAYAQDGKPDQALEKFEQAVRFVPDFAEAYRGMADAYTALGKPDHAAYARAMEAFSQKDYALARTQLEQTVVKLPDFAPAYLGLGLTYEQLGDLAGAQAQLERALELDPQNFAAGQALGRITAQLGK